MNGHGERRLFLSFVEFYCTGVPLWPENSGMAGNNWCFCKDILEKNGVIVISIQTCWGIVIIESTLRFIVNSVSVVDSRSIHTGEYISRGIRKIRRNGPFLSKHEKVIPTGWAFLHKYGIWRDVF